MINFIIFLDVSGLPRLFVCVSVQKLAKSLPDNFAPVIIFRLELSSDHSKSTPSNSASSNFYEVPWKEKPLKTLDFQGF